MNSETTNKGKKTMKKDWLGKQYIKRASLIGDQTKVTLDSLGCMTVSHKEGDEYYFNEFEVDEMKIQYQECSESFKNTCDFETFIKVTSQDW